MKQFVFALILAAASVAHAGGPYVFDYRENGRPARVEVFITDVTEEPLAQTPDLEALEATPVCYKLAAAWKRPVDWAVKGTEFPVAKNTVIGLMTQAMNIWESAAGTRRIFGENDQGILGFRAPESYAQFAHMSNPFLAVTMRHSRQKPNGTYEPTRWTILYSLDHPWATDGRADAYDFLSVAAHETGHVAGLGHPDPSACPDETMYPGIFKGELKKRTLHTGDIAGINALY